jgi:hypothetical protein
MKSRLFLAAICFFFLTTSISFGYNATFLPKLTVLGEYTDNVLLTQDSDLKEHDVITTVTPGFVGELDGKKGNARLSYDASYAFYDKFNEFNGWRHQAILAGNYMITKNTRFNIGDDFYYTEDPIRYDNVAVVRTENPTTPIDFTERKSREIYTTNFANAEINHQFGKYHSFRIGYNHYLYSYEDPTTEDKQSHNPTIGLTYWFGPKWGFDITGGYSRDEYEHSNSANEYSGSLSLLKRFGKNFIGYIRYSHYVVNIDGQSGEDTTYMPTIGIKYNIEKDISLIADFGYFFSNRASSDNQSSPTGDLRLIKNFKHGQLNLALLGGYDYSLLDSESLGYGVYYEGDISLTYQLAKHVYGNFYGSYRNTEYKDASDRTDKIPSVGLELTWEALQWMNVGLNYRFRSVDSTVDTENYNENRVGVKITLTTKHPFHTSRY